MLSCPAPVHALIATMPGRQPISIAGFGKPRKHAPASEHRPPNRTAVYLPGANAASLKKGCGLFARAGRTSLRTLRSAQRNCRNFAGDRLAPTRPSRLRSRAANPVCATTPCRRRSHRIFRTAASTIAEMNRSAPTHREDATLHFTSS